MIKTDLEIANSIEKKHIKEIAKSIGLNEDNIEFYGKYKAKIDYEKISNNSKAKLILVTAINPTPAGEGKTTTTVGLGDALSSLGKKTVIALREPSLGPVFGVKGGAAGGGYSQVVPMEDINLHFTGDFHAITSANNLLCAIIDNHIKQGNELNIDPTKITFKRVMDMNDRQLRNIVCGLGGKANGVPREDSFQITVASEIMAIFCLSENVLDLKEKLGNIIIGFNTSNKPVYCKDLKVNGAMAALLKEAIKPNLVQTLEHTPCIIHGGPFANIAHGCNSFIATKTAMNLGDYVVTEAGFGADLGAEKFINIKCRKKNLKPDACVIVATVRALKYNGGVEKTELFKENLVALKNGICNLVKHIENIKDTFKINTVVALNRFLNDTDEEVNLLVDECKKLGVNVEVSEMFSKGSKGGINLAKKVIELVENNENNFKLLYDDNLSIEEKIIKISKTIYGASDVIFSDTAKKSLELIKSIKGTSTMPICMAKTQYSFSDNPKLLGRPENFTITIKNLNLSNGAEFIVAFTGDIMTMPGLSKTPSAVNIDVTKNGDIIGLF